MVISNIKVLSFNTIGSSGRTALKKEILEVLRLTVGDEILFILDKDGFITIRKYPSELMPGEKYLSTAKIFGERIAGKYPPKLKPGKGFLSTSELEARIPLKYYTGFGTHIPRDVVNMLDLDEDREILWILDEYRHVMIKNTLLFPRCSKKIFNRNISAIVINLTKIMVDEEIIVSREIEDIIGIDVGSQVMFFIDEFDNIIISTISLPYRLLGVSKVYSVHNIKINLDILKHLKVDIDGDILWILDENGNIIIRDTILPYICLNK